MKKLVLVLISATFSMSALAGGGSSIGPANPASSQCGRLGGSWSILEDERQNQWGFCRFGTALIEEWTLHRHLAGEASLATKAFLYQRERTGIESGVPNPAYQMCAQLGGRIMNWRGSLGYPTQAPELLCGFYDGSVIGAWTLLRGPRYERQLAFILSAARR